MGFPILRNHRIEQTNPAANLTQQLANLVVDQVILPMSTSLDCEPSFTTIIHGLLATTKFWKMNKHETWFTVISSSYDVYYNKMVRRKQ